MMSHTTPARMPIKDGTKGTVRIYLRDCPPIEIPAALYLDGRLALHHEIKDGKVLNTRTLVISHVRTGMKIFEISGGKVVALKVMDALMQAGKEWDFGEFGIANPRAHDRGICAGPVMQPRVQAAMDAAMVVMHGGRGLGRR